MTVKIVNCKTYYFLIEKVIINKVIIHARSQIKSPLTMLPLRKVASRRRHRTASQTRPLHCRYIQRELEVVYFSS